MGRCTRAITPAIVNDLPDPVMPSRVWNRSPASTPSTSASIAAGWSPDALNSETSSMGGTTSMVPAPYDTGTGPVRVTGPVDASPGGQPRRCWRSRQTSSTWDSSAARSPELSIT